MFGKKRWRDRCGREKSKRRHVLKSFPPIKRSHLYKSSLPPPNKKEKKEGGKRKGDRKGRRSKTALYGMSLAAPFFKFRKKKRRGRGRGARPVCQPEKLYLPSPEKKKKRGKKGRRDRPAALLIFPEEKREKAKEGEKEKRGAVWLAD